MGVDYDTLSTWKTPDLMSRDSRLMGKTRVMGVSQTAAIIHIVAFVCTSGVSLPINLAFCIWHSHRYGKVKKERKWIRQILGTRNVAYQGRGHWVNVNPNPNAAQSRNANPRGAQSVYNPPPEAQWVYNNPSASHSVQGTPSEGQWVDANTSEGHWVDANTSEGHWVDANTNEGHWVDANTNEGHWVDANTNEGHWVQEQPTPGIGQRVQVTPTPQADNDLQMQFVQAAANASLNDLQQDFGNSDAYSEDTVAYDQSYYD